MNHKSSSLCRYLHEFSFWHYLIVYSRLNVVFVRWFYQQIRHQRQKRVRDQERIHHRADQCNKRRYNNPNNHPNNLRNGKNTHTHTFSIYFFFIFHLLNSKQRKKKVRKKTLTKTCNMVGISVPSPLHTRTLSILKNK